MVTKKSKKKKFRRTGSRSPLTPLKLWETSTLAKVLHHTQERQREFTTISFHPIERLYTPEHLKGGLFRGALARGALARGAVGRGTKGRGFNYSHDLGFPGEFPFTRGVYATMHRGRLWTMRQFAGFGSPTDTNARFKYLLAQGQTGLSTAFHFPTLMGYDSDSARARGEVGVCGVAVDSLADMEILFDGIPLDKVSVSMTINGPASIMLAFYLANAEKRGFAFNKLGGTIQNDVLKEYIAQNSYLVPPEPAIKIVVDMIEYCSFNLPQWNPVSISGYHIREAGSTAVQELAFTLADGLAYVGACVNRGLDVDSFAPRLSFFFNSHIDFFEEVAKFRAARRLWARLMKKRFNPKKKESLKCRFHVQTAGVSLTAQQAENNIVRTTLEALAAVLGGCQSLHTNSMDETLALPTEKAVRIALRTQQIIAHESGVANTIDPLGGSYFLESLTTRMENEAEEMIEKIDHMGGMVEAIKRGYPQAEIARASHEYQQAVEEKKKMTIGVNEFVLEDEPPVEILKIDPEVEKRQIENLKKLKLTRDPKKISPSLHALEKGAKTDQNLMPLLLDCARAYCTVGEISDVLRKVFGEYHDPGIF